MVGRFFYRGYRGGQIVQPIVATAMHPAQVSPVQTQAAQIARLRHVMSSVVRRRVRSINLFQFFCFFFLRKKLFVKTLYLRNLFLVYTRATL